MKKATKQSQFSRSFSSAAPALPLPKPVATAAPSMQTTGPQSVQAVERGAAFLRDGIFASSLLATVDKNVAEAIPATAFQLYREALLNDLDGQHTDPLAVMLAEQLSCSHHSVLRLQARAGQAQSADEIQMLSNAASQLMGEFRRSAVIFRELQSRSRVNGSPVRASKIENGERCQPQGELVDAQNNRPRTELRGNQSPHESRETIVPFQESASRRRRKTKSA